MDFIEPLNLEVFVVNVFSGSFEIFTAISIIVIMGLAGYFRMTKLTMLFMFGLFLIMFSGFVDPSLYFFILAIASLVIGVTISKLVKN
jgi:hypothetical protein